ncbi:helix-turn-helix domain-containing protein [Vicingaceae bacterium]|nr:helix-turn-helix domain-containing protein [Vicingaceae bacterium]
MNEDKLLTKYQVMDYLNISRRHFEKLVTEENLPIIKITQNKRYVRSSHLNRYIDERTINKPQETNQESEPEESFQWKNIWGKN